MVVSNSTILVFNEVVGVVSAVSFITFNSVLDEASTRKGLLVKVKAKLEKEDEKVGRGRVRTMLVVEREEVRVEGTVDMEAIDVCLGFKISF